MNKKKKIKKNGKNILVVKIRRILRFSVENFNDVYRSEASGQLGA